MSDTTAHVRSAALLGAGALTIAVTTALELATSPYSPAVSAFELNGVVHVAKVIGVVVFVLGMLGLRVALRDQLGTVGRAAVLVIPLATVLGAVPYSVAEATLDPSLTPAAADARLNGIYDAHPWISSLAMVALPLVVLSIVALAVSVLRRRALPAWAPVMTLVALPVAIAAGVLTENGAVLPHPPAWVFLGLAAYAPALARRRLRTSPAQARDSQEPGAVRAHLSVPG